MISKPSGNVFFVSINHLKAIIFCRLNDTHDTEASGSGSHDETENSAPFFTDGPLYLKRYEYVLQLLADERWNRVLRRV